MGVLSIGFYVFFIVFVEFVLTFVSCLRGWGFILSRGWGWGWSGV